MTDPATLEVPADESVVPLFRRGAWGRLAMALLPLVGASGVVLTFLYRPGPDAWWSVAAIRGGDWGVVRDLHRWGGELLLIAAWLHLFRVFMVGAYRRLPGWSISVAGTLFVMASMATGWLLRQDAPVFAYALHVLVLPSALVFAVWVWRLWVRRLGPRAGEPDGDGEASV